MSNPDPNNRHRHPSWPPPTDSKPIPPSSWAKKTGFKPKFSGETNASNSGQINRLPPEPPQVDLEAGSVRPPSNGVVQSNNVNATAVPVAVPVVKDQTVKKRRDSDGVPSTNGQVNPAPGTGTGTGTEQATQVRRTSRNEEVVDGLVVDDEGFASRHAHMKYELRDFPGLGIIRNVFGNFGVLNFIYELRNQTRTPDT